MKKCLPLLALTVLLTSACSTARPRVVVPALNPDMTPVVMPVKRATASAITAKASTGKAAQSTAKAIQLAEKIKASPEQEATIRELRLTLQTTSNELQVANVALDAIQKELVATVAASAELQNEIGSLQNQVIAERRKADIAFDARDKEHAKAVQNGKERDLFVNLFAVTLTILVLMVAAPIIKAFSASMGAWAPAVAIGCWIAAAAGAYLAAFWLIRLILHFAVTLL